MANAKEFFLESAAQQMAAPFMVVEGRKFPVSGEELLCVVLEEDTTFDLEDGRYLAKAGDVIYENGDDDEDEGYTVTSQMSFRQKYMIL
jgi:hypothetical protein